MHTEGVQWPPTGQLDNAVKNTAAGVGLAGNIDIFPESERVLAEDGVTVVALPVDGILAVGIVGPEPVGQVLEVGNVGKTAALALVAAGFPVDLLEKDDIGVLLLEQLPHPAQHEALVAGIKTLVDVVGNYLDVGHRVRTGRRVAPSPSEDRAAILPQPGRR